MRHGRTLLCGLILCCAVPLSSASAGDLEESAWRDAAKEAKSLMKSPGYRVRKEEYVAKVGKDNSDRAAKLLMRWAVRSLKMQRGKLGKEMAKARKDYDKALPKKVRDKKSYERYLAAFEKARESYEVETNVQFAIGEALAAITNADAVRYLIDDGLPSLQKQKGTESLQVTVARSLLKQPKDLVREYALATAKDPSRPKLRILAVNWIGLNGEKDAYDTLLDALKQPPVAVQRAAVFALQGLDDRRCVKPLIDAMQESSGLLTHEIDLLLHRFTGKSFEASAVVWKQWWAREGTAWLEKPDPKRFAEIKKVQKKGATMVRFYGIPTPSRHVVFVVDRSKSMRDPAGDQSRAPDKGPTTGGDPKAGSGGIVKGDTRMEVAKNQVILSIDELAKEVKFGIVFYSNEVLTWKKPPELMASTPQNKDAAKAYVKTITPYGPTLTFGALMTALDYAAVVDPKNPKETGANTIFLLSDGSPTTSDSRVLEGDELEQAYRAFIARNELYHCVVHTIGIGPNHNWSILKRLARDTGGTYKAIGTK